MDAKIVALLKTAEDISKRLDNLINAISVLTEKHKQFSVNVAALDERLSFLERCQFASVDDSSQPSSCCYATDSPPDPRGGFTSDDDDDDDDAAADDADDDKTPPYGSPESASDV